MLYESKVTRQGQTTIPKAIREKYGIEEGDEITYVDLGDHVFLLPKPRDPVEDLKKIRIEEEASVQEIKAIALNAAVDDVEQRLSRSRRC
jgi:AbrB family looped-hinge helix DNA binding protein